MNIYVIKIPDDNIGTDEYDGAVVLADNEEDASIMFKKEALMMYPNWEIGPVTIELVGFDNDDYEDDGSEKPPRVLLKKFDP